MILGFPVPCELHPAGCISPGCPAICRRSRVSGPYRLGGGDPFLAAAVGMWVQRPGGRCHLARRGYDQAKTRKTAIVIGLVLSALGTLLVVQSST